MKRDPYYHYKSPKWHKRVLTDWSVNENEPAFAELIAAFAVFVMLLIVAYVYIVAFAPEMA